MKKISGICIGLWLLVALGSPLFLAPMVEKEIKSLQQYPEITLLEYQRHFFFARVRLNMTGFGKTEEIEEDITYSPFLFNGLNWIKADGKALTGRVDLVGNIKAKLGLFLWQSHISNPKKGILTTGKEAFQVAGRDVQLDPWRAEIDLQHKTAISTEFSGSIKHHGKIYPITGKNLTLSHNGNDLVFQVAELSLGVGKITDLKGEISLSDHSASASFIPKFPFPLTGFNDQALKLKWINPMLIIMSKNKSDRGKNLRMILDFQKKDGVVALNPDFAKKSGLAFMLKYQFGELPHNEEGNLILPLFWNKKGLFIHGKLMADFS